MNNRSEKIFRLIFGEFLWLVEMLIITFFLAILTFTYVFHIATVKGDSMENTLISGDKLITTVGCHSPEQGDIVIIYANDAVTLDDNRQPEIKKGLRKSLVKRVIAV